MLRILIAEDEDKILHILDKIVRSAGHDTILAGDGEEGAALALEHTPDLILTDIFMPRLNGLELCQKLKFDRKTSEIAIIVITASSESPDLFKIFRYGANAWIKKPFTRIQVLETIEQVYQEQQLYQKKQVIGNWIDFNLSSTMDILQSLNQFIENLLSHTKIEPKEARQFSFAVNEMLLNAMEHGNQFDISKKVKVSYVLFKEKLIIKIEDEGKGFLPAEVPDPIRHPVEVAQMRQKAGKRPGGYGIAVTRQYVDSVEFSDAGNSLLLTKLI